MHYAVLLPPLQVCLERIASRAKHGFADLDAAEHMWRDFDHGTSGLQRHLPQDVVSPATLARRIAKRVTDGTLGYDVEDDQSP